MLPKYSTRYKDLDNMYRDMVRGDATDESTVVIPNWMDNIEIWRNGRRMNPLKNFTLVVDPEISDYPIWSENEPND